MYPPIMDPALLRYQQIFGQPQYGNDMPEQGGFAGVPIQLPERLGATDQLGGLPNVIDPGMIGSESIPQNPEQNIARRLQELYSPETAANDRLSQLLGQYPQRQDPGTLAKIVGSLVGLNGGPNASDRVMYGNYERDVQDWQNQVRPAEYLANQERYANQNERQYANQVLTQELNRDKLDEKTKNDEANIKIREKRAAAYDFKQRNPNMTIKMDKQGNFVGINPQTGQSQFITDASGQPVNGREMSFEDKQNILQENALERIDAMGDRQLGMLGPKAASEVATFKAKEEIKNSDESLTPEQERSARLARAEALVNEHPELSGWVENDGKSVTIRDTYTPGWFGAAVGRQAENPATRKAIVDHVINGKTLVLPSAKGNNETINPNNTKLPEGKIKVIAPDGTVGMIPMSRLDAYLKGGYKKAN